MNWITGTLGSSIGKKLMMAITGFSFCGFLAAHLAGNLTIYGARMRSTVMPSIFTPWGRC